MTRKAVVKKLDEWFSKFIRLSYADDTGQVACYTCGRKNHWKKMQCGHFMSRAKYATRWDEDNCRPQCYGCNMRQQGQQYLFSLNLNKEQPGLAERMRIKSMQTVKFTTPQLLEKIEHYRQEVRTLQE